MMMRQRGRSTRSADRGAVFIEFALVVPILMLFAMGIVEYGMGWYAANNVNAAARDAARAGSSAASYDFADRSVIRQIASALGDSDGEIQRVVVFKASSTHDDVPSACVTNALTTRGVSGLCNIYSAADVDWVRTNMTSTSHFTNGGSSCDGSDWDRRWCPVERKHSQANQDLDYLGVYIKLKHDSVTNFGFGDQMINRTAVFRLEPKYGGS